MNRLDDIVPTPQKGRELPHTVQRPPSLPSVTHNKLAEERAAKRERAAKIQGVVSQITTLFANTSQRLQNVTRKEIFAVLSVIAVASLGGGYYLGLRNGGGDGAAVLTATSPSSVTTTNYANSPTSPDGVAPASVAAALDSGRGGVETAGSTVPVPTTNSVAQSSEGIRTLQGFDLYGLQARFDQYGNENEPKEFYTNDIMISGKAPPGTKVILYMGMDDLTAEVGEDGRWTLSSEVHYGSYPVPVLLVTDKNTGDVKLYAQLQPIDVKRSEQSPPVATEASTTPPPVATEAGPAQSSTAPTNEIESILYPDPPAVQIRIEPGDTLGKLAQQFTGDPNRHTEITNLPQNIRNNLDPMNLKVDGIVYLPAGWNVPEERLVEDR